MQLSLYLFQTQNISRHKTKKDIEFISLCIYMAPNILLQQLNNFVEFEYSSLLLIEKENTTSTFQCI